MITASKTFKLQERGIDPNMIGHINYDQEGRWHKKSWDIRISLLKIGFWTSDTWKIYIHRKIAKLSEDIAQKVKPPDTLSKNHFL